MLYTEYTKDGDTLIMVRGVLPPALVKQIRALVGDYDPQQACRERQAYARAEVEK